MLLQMERFYFLLLQYIMWKLKTNQTNQTKTDSEKQKPKDAFTRGGGRGWVKGEGKYSQ